MRRAKSGFITLDISRWAASIVKREIRRLSTVPAVEIGETRGACPLVELPGDRRKARDATLARRNGRRKRGTGGGETFAGTCRGRRRRSTPTGGQLINCLPIRGHDYGTRREFLPGMVNAVVVSHCRERCKRKEERRLAVSRCVRSAADARERLAVSHREIRGSRLAGEYAEKPRCRRTNLSSRCIALALWQAKLRSNKCTWRFRG